VHTRYFSSSYKIQHVSFTLLLASVLLQSGCADIRGKVDTLSPNTYKQAYRYGYVDKTGRFVIEPKYFRAEPFHDGLAKVSPSVFVEQGTESKIVFRIAYIDHQGNQHPISNDSLQKHTARRVGSRKPASRIWFDTNGAELFEIDAQLEEKALLWHNPHSRAFWKGGAKLADGLMPVCVRASSKSLWGYVNNKGKLVIPPQFSDCSNFSNGLAVVAVTRNSGANGTGNHTTYGLINTRGVFVIKPEYQMIDRFSEGLAAIKQHDRWGYINTHNKVVVKPSFLYAFPFREGLAGVAWDDKVENDDRHQNGANSRLAFVNRSGKIVIPPKYLIAAQGAHFSNGLAVVVEKLIGKTGQVLYKFGYINRQGDLVIPARFYRAGDFSEGLANAAINFSSDSQRSSDEEDLYSSKGSRLWLIPSPSL